MSAPKHMPAPWRYEYEEGFCGELIAANGRTVATFVDEPSEEDARLIAAAPDLLEALLAAEEVARVGIISAANQGLLQRAEELRRTAIAKAAGGQP